MYIILASATNMLASATYELSRFGYSWLTCTLISGHWKVCMIMNGCCVFVCTHVHMCCCWWCVATHTPWYQDDEDCESKLLCCQHPVGGGAETQLCSFCCAAVLSPLRNHEGCVHYQYWTYLYADINAPPQLRSTAAEAIC